jgi:hypothetical protein
MPAPPEESEPAIVRAMGPQPLLRRKEALRLDLEGREAVRMPLAQDFRAEIGAVMVVMAMRAGHAELADPAAVELLPELEGFLRRAVDLDIHRHPARLQLHIGRHGEQRVRARRPGRGFHLVLPAQIDALLQVDDALGGLLELGIGGADAPHRLGGVVVAGGA